MIHQKIKLARPFLKNLQPAAENFNKMIETRKKEENVKRRSESENPRIRFYLEKPTCRMMTDPFRLPLTRLIARALQNLQQHQDQVRVESGSCGFS